MFFSDSQEQIHWNTMLGYKMVRADHMLQEDIAKLLRFESSKLAKGEMTSLEEYGTRMKAGARNIFYLSAPRYIYKSTDRNEERIRSSVFMNFLAEEKLL